MVAFKIGDQVVVNNIPTSGSDKDYYVINELSHLKTYTVSGIHSHKQYIKLKDTKHDLWHNVTCFELVNDNDMNKINSGDWVKLAVNPMTVYSKADGLIVENTYKVTDSSGRFLQLEGCKFLYMSKFFYKIDPDEVFEYQSLTKEEQASFVKKIISQMILVPDAFAAYKQLSKQLEKTIK